MTGGRGTTVVMTPSTEDAAFIILALRAHAETYRRNGITVPTGVSQFEAHLASGVTAGQASSTSDRRLRTEQIEVMTPRLVRYDTAAELLDISVSSLKRRITAGDLHPISIGGASRIRVAEIDDYINTQTSTQEAR